MLQWTQKERIMQSLGKFSRFFGTRHHRARKNHFFRSYGPMLTVEALESRALLNGNGPDSTFGTGGTVVTDLGGVDVAAKVLVQPNGKIVAPGFRSYPEERVPSGSDSDPTLLDFCPEQQNPPRNWSEDPTIYGK
jgi:hypothetical protein